jgi:hypothetical protein
MKGSITSTLHQKNLTVGALKRWEIHVEY